jgi:hypothetical protein
MSQENMEVVQSIYEAWNRSGGVPPLDFIDPAIETEFVGSLDFAGKYRGHAGLATLLESFWGAFDNHRIEVEECVPVRDCLVVTVDYYGRGMASGVDVDLRGWQFGPCVTAGRLGGGPLGQGKKPSKPWGCRSKTLTPTPEPAGF